MEISDATLKAIISGLESSIMKLKDQLLKIPQSTEYRANRYDTDDEYVLHLWNDKGNSYDIRIKK